MATEGTTQPTRPGESSPAADVARWLRGLGFTSGAADPRWFTSGTVRVVVKGDDVTVFAGPDWGARLIGPPPREVVAAVLRVAGITVEG